jgi:N-dimethylarginine dimethylaminohydrolase
MSEESRKFKFMNDEIEGYLFDMRRAMDIYEGLVRRESPESANKVRDQFDMVMNRIKGLQDKGKSMHLPDGLEPLKEAVALCKDSLKRVEVGVNQFSQTEIRVERR